MSEAFKAFLESKVANGIIANKEIQEYAEQEQYLRRTGYYPED